MNARLCSLLVAGGVALVTTQQGRLLAASPELEAVRKAATLQGISLEEKAGESARVVLDVPGFLGTPQVQFLLKPSRVVVDLPGVLKSSGVTKKDLAGLSTGLVVRSRVAQFSPMPEPVTRLVLEISPDVKVDVQAASGRVELLIRGGGGLSGNTVSSLPPSEDVTFPVVSSALVPNFDLPRVPSGVGFAEPGDATARPVVQEGKALAPVPSLASSSFSLSGLGVSTLLPVSVNGAPPSALPVPTQEPGKREVAPMAAKQSGKTLGEAPSKYTGAKMSIDVQGADLVTFLRILADAGHLNLIVDNDVKGNFSFKFTDTPWDQILDLVLKNAGLGKSLENGVLRVATNEQLKKEEDQRKALEESKALGGDTQSVTRHLSYAKVAEARAVLEKVLTKRGSVINDERTNTMIITDLPKNLGLLDDLLATLDVQIQQVQIEAKVVEASDSYEKAFGVKWPTSNSGSANLTIGGAAAPWGSSGTPSWNSASNKSNGSVPGTGVAFNGGADGVTSIAGAAGEAWISFLSDRLSINVILQALEKEGKVKIVSSPKLVTQNNKKAKILSGEKIPYPSQQGGAAGGAITVAFAQANLELDVTPQITAEGTIIMDLSISKAEADFSRTVQGQPTIIQREIQTQVLVRDGGTAVLGGVYTSSKSSGFTGVPFLSKLPIIGGLFRTRSNKDQNNELLIFITPRVIKN